MTVRVGAVVEDHGEVRALPILIRRICEAHEVFDLHVEHPYRLPRTQMLNGRLVGAVRMQRIRVGDNGVVLVLLDADDDDPGKMQAQITSILGRGAGGTTVIAVAVREYEAWFLAAIESLRGHGGVSGDAVFDGEPERPRDAKGVLATRMTESYRETLHQARFSAVMDLAQARGRSPSFAAFEADLLAALARAGAI